MQLFADAGLCAWLDADWSMGMPVPMKATLEQSRQSCSIAARRDATPAG
jgi:hypothetical protein